MKKYLILGMAVAVIAAAVVLSLPEKPNAALPSFYGSSPEGSKVRACLAPFYELCYETYADQYDIYEVPRTLPQGTYELHNGCTSHQDTYSGGPVRSDFCVPPPACVCE